MLLKHEDHASCVEMLLNNQNKFKCIDKDPTTMRLKTVQNYLIVVKLTKRMKN